MDRTKVRSVTYMVGSGGACGLSGSVVGRELAGRHPEELLTVE